MIGRPRSSVHATSADRSRWIREEVRAGRRTVATHGVSGYSQGCRCEICREGSAEYHRNRRAAVAAGAEVKSHGLSGYTLGCRCEICVTVRREYHRQWGHRQANAQAQLCSAYRAGDRSPQAVAAHVAASREYRRGLADAAIPQRRREALLSRLCGGRPFADAVDGAQLTAAAVWGLARRDPKWARALDAALTKGRDPRLRHGSEAAYRAGGCRCPECRAAHARYR